MAIFSKNLGLPSFLSPPSLPFLKILFLSPLLFTDPSLQNEKYSLPPSKTLKLLHTKVIRCVKMFLLINSTSNTKDFAKVVYLSFYFENLGRAVFKEHLSVPVSLTKNFHCNLPFLI